MLVTFQLGGKTNRKSLGTWQTDFLLPLIINFETSWLKVIIKMAKIFNFILRKQTMKQ